MRMKKLQFCDVELCCNQLTHCAYTGIFALKTRQNWVRVRYDAKNVTSIDGNTEHELCTIKFKK